MKRNAEPRSGEKQLSPMLERRGGQQKEEQVQRDGIIEL
jgi:hypothetical protein